MASWLNVKCSMLSPPACQLLLFVAFILPYKPHLVPVASIEEDMARQAILERLGWRFVRIRGSQFFRNPDIAIEPVFTRLSALDIPSEGSIAQNSGDPSGQELKNGIIRRADELRGQWKESTDHSVSDVVSTRSQNRDTGSVRPVTSGNASGRTSLSSTK